MTGKDDYQSSEDLIRQARSDLEESQVSEAADGGDMAVPVDNAPDQDVVRPADRIPSRSARPLPPEHLSKRPPPPAPQPVVAPTGADPKPRRSGGWLAMLIGIVLLVSTAMTLLTFVSGFISDDPEVTENVIGFLILLAMTGVPGVLLVRWARRGRSRASS